MIYNPFEIQQTSEEELVNAIKILVEKCNENEQEMSDFATTVIDLTDVLYIYGELYARTQKDYLLKKYNNNTKEAKLEYQIKKEATEKGSSSYYKAIAQEKMLKDREEEYNLQLSATRLKLAYDSTQEKINALKKKIDAMKYEF